MATNYRRGYVFENQIVNFWRGKGYYATRTAGSHTPIDVICWDENEVWLIQAKASKMTGPELEAAKEALGGVPFPHLVGDMLPGTWAAGGECYQIRMVHREIWVKSPVRGEDWTRYEA